MLSSFAEPAYPSFERFAASWEELCLNAAGRVREVGRSVQGRPLLRYDFGPKGSGTPTTLLTGLTHGVEYIGALALREAVRALVADPVMRSTLPFRLVVLPVVNPDALADNCRRLRDGRQAFRRCNAHGVDLNRNFPRAPGAWSLHPFSGSRFRFSPHYLGPHPFSEPETRAVAAVAAEVRPVLSLAFHSFGEVLLYPWAHKRERHPHSKAYRALGAAFLHAQQTPYRLMPSIGLYPVIGDMDDWLDASFETTAFTIEVGRFDARLRDRLRQPFWWMNPKNVDATVANVVPAVQALLTAAAAREPSSAESPAEAPRSFKLAAR